MGDRPFYITQTVIICAIVLLGLSAAGCEVIGGIFKAGIWVGVIIVAVIVGLIMMIVRRK
jgi:hypothetical protein